MLTRAPGLLVALALAGAAAGDSLPCFRIPRMARPPVIDGAIDLRDWPRDEWAAAVHLMGFTLADRPGPASVLAHARLGYDSDNLYFACSISGMEPGDIRCSAKGPDTTAWEDESVELHVGVGDASERVYQFVVNAEDVPYDAVNQAGRHDRQWTAPWRHAARREPDGWSVEVAVPWRSIGLESSTDGAVLRVNVGHNHTVTGVTLPEVSSWGPLRDDQGKAAPLDSLKTLPRARLCADAPFASATVFIDKGDRPGVRLRAANPAGREASLRYALSEGAWRDMAVAAGGTESIRIPVTLDDADEGRQLVVVEDARGETVFRQVVRFRSRIGASLSLKTYFPVNYVELLIGVPLPADAEARLSVTDAAAAAVAVHSWRPGPGRPTPLRVDIAAWKESVPHNLTLAVADQAGEVLAERRFIVTRPPKPPWLGTHEGLSDRPLAPYTPIEVRGDAFSCLLKSYDFRGRALPAAVRSEGRDLLAEPMSLMLSVGGREADLAATRIRVTRAAPNRVEWASDGLQVAGVRVSHAGWMEEDGFTWHEVTFDAAEPVAVDSLDFLVPMRRTFALFYNGTLPLDVEHGDEVGRIAEGGHTFRRFMQIVSLLDYERGLCVVTDDPEPWRPKDLDTCQGIEVRGDQAVLRYRVIGQPTRVEGRRRFEFGLMAMPAKPVPRNTAGRRMIHDVHFNDAAMSSGLEGSAFVEYAAAAGLDPGRGTVEVYLLPDFDATQVYPDPDVRWQHARRLFRVANGENWAHLLWSPHTRCWEFGRGAQRTADVNLKPAAPLPWDRPAWRHVAVTWGEAVRLYADGALLAEQTAAGLLPGGRDLAEATLRLGKEDPSYRAEFRVAAVRISSRALAPGEMALDGRFQARPDTLLLHDFGDLARAGGLPPPRRGAPPVGRGAARVEAAAGRQALVFGPVPDLSRIEHAARIGVKMLGFHDRWTLDYGLPRTELKASLCALLDTCHRHGIRLVVYLGYGVGRMTPESRLYEDFWAVHPLHPWTGGGRRTFVAYCNSTPYVRDFQVDGVARLFDEFDLDGLYYDHVQTPMVCSNPHHGCGWTDPAGARRGRSRVLPAREFIKRLYAAVKARRPDGFIDCHGSGYVCPVRAAWVDRLYIGELYRKVPFTFEHFTIACRGEPHGMATDALWWHGLAFPFERMLAFTLLHDIEPRPMLWKRDQVAVMERLWKVKDAFDTDNAEWRPYWNADGLVRAAGAGCYASLYLHRGRRGLVVLSNTGDQPATAEATLALARLGLRGEARDAFTGEAVPLAGGKAAVPLPGPGLKLIWVE